MSAVVVRCPSCKQLSRVAESSAGQFVACPHCDFQFIPPMVGPPPDPAPAPARQRPIDIPVIQPRSRPGNRPAPPDADDEPPTLRPHTPTSLPIALAFAPLGIPLVWLVVNLTAGHTAFSFAAPVAVGLSACGLGFGLAFADRWSLRVRTRCLIALIALAYLAAGTLYFTPPDWLEATRVFVMQAGAEWKWKEFKADDGSFKVKFPGESTEGDSPLKEWELQARRYGDPKMTDVFVAAYGPLPKNLRGTAEEPFFESVKKALLADGEIVREQSHTLEKGAIARDFEIKLPTDRTAKRVVRVVRAGTRVYYLSVDGPSISFDARDVRFYFSSFTLTGK